MKFRNWAWTLAFIVMISVAVGLGRTDGASGRAQEISYSQFKTLLAAKMVKSVEMEGAEIVGTLARPQPLTKTGKTVDRFKTNIPAIGDPKLLSIFEEAGTEITVNPNSSGGLGNWGWIAIWVIFGSLYFWYWRKMTGNMPGGPMQSGGLLGKFLRPTSQQAKQTAPDVKFSDVAGQENAKREVSELVDFLSQAESYRRLGAEVPRGVLLMGAPGTGKTLLAKALAGEAGVPFFSISASEFIEIFVGVGASRVRNLFADAKKAAPSIIFIDELDSIGRVRGTGLGGGNDEREQTLNQILAELDGFTGREAVVVLAATNRPDVLDPALLRPGRFDRHVTLDLPDKKAREEILRVHTRDMPLAMDVDLGAVAAGTPGFSGADLKNLTNEAAMRAARRKADTVTGEDFEQMRERVLMGSERTLAIQPEEKHRLAVHEAGHTLAAFHLSHTDPLYKVSIIPRGRSLGATQQMPQGERYIMDEDYLRDRLTVLLGGRAAEKLILGSLSSGADDDIHQATNLARMMVARWGMSDEVGPMDARESEEHPFLGREIAQPRHSSETTALAIDAAVRQLLITAHDNASNEIERHLDGFKRLCAALEEHEILDQAEITRLLTEQPENMPAKPRVVSG